MTIMTRRDLLALAGTVCVRASARAWSDDLAGQVAELERRAGGRLGVCVLDVETGSRAGHRLDERFAMCSTFKLPLAGLVLREADQGRLDLATRIPFGEADMLAFAPVTRPRLAEGRMSVVDLAEAAQVTSDNVAANLLLALLGGPAGYTAKLRALGDEHTRLDRLEPMMNLVLTGDVRDTTTPRAMATTVAGFLRGGWLTVPSAARLVSWMERTTTGTKRIRAGLPAGWRAGDKTGTGMAAGMTDKYNDVAAMWPPGRGVAIVAVYYDSSRTSTEMRDDDQARLAEAGRLCASWLTRR